MHICGVEGRLNWMPLLCLNHDLRESGRPAPEGAQTVTNPLLTRRAALYFLHSLADNLASNGPSVRRHNMHLYPCNTVPSVACHTGYTVAEVAPSGWIQLYTGTPKL